MTRGIWRGRQGHPNPRRLPDHDSEILGDDDAWKVVVPQEHRQAVLRECYDEAVAGHLGREKTFVRVAQHYYWPRYYSEVGDYVRSCQVCQQYKVQ